MKKIDWEYLQGLLEQLAERYPSQAEPAALGLDPEDRKLTAATAYLMEHGLIDAHIEQLMSGPPQVLSLRATHRGLDFLQPDGGLTALLNVTTVRLEAETLRALIANRVESSDAAPEEKRSLMQWVQTAGTEALSEATRRLVGAALDQAPNVLQLLQTLRS